MSAAASSTDAVITFDLSAFIKAAAAAAPATGADSAVVDPLVNGHYGHLTPSQLTALEQFLTAVKPEHEAVKQKRREADAKRAATANWDKDLPDFVDRPPVLSVAEEEQQFVYEALRFLRSRQFDVEKAVEKYKKYVTWYDSINGYTLLDALPPKWDLVKRIVPSLCAHDDSQHRPLYIELDGSVDRDAILHYFAVDETLDIHVWLQELLMRRCLLASQKHKRNIETVANILDMSGLALDHRRVLKYVQPVFACDEQYYPERLGTLFVTNPPWVFPVIWNIVKFWLDPVTKSKIVVVKGKPGDALLSHFPASSLPAQFCGTNPELPVPDISDLLKALGPKGPGDLHLETIKIKAGKAEKKTIESTATTGCTYSWYIKTVKHDISLSAEFIAASSSSSSSSSSSTEPEIVVEKARMNGEKVAIQGSWTSTRPGTLVFTFDNTFSWMKGKTIQYLLTAADDVKNVGADTEKYDPKAKVVEAEADASPTASSPDDD